MSQEKRLGWLVPGYPPLKCDDAVGKAAVEGQMVYYPKVVRSNADNPIPGQSMGCLSFMLFREPHKPKNGKPVYGFVKLRGNWTDQSQAENHSMKIIQEMDSKFPVRIGPVGTWLPITEESGFNKETKELDLENMDEYKKEAMRERREEEVRIKRELREKEDEVKHGGDIYDDPLSLDFYTMKRVTDQRLREMLDIKRKGLISLENKIVITQKILKRLEKEKPEYREQWIDRYNEKRREGGITDYRPSEKELEEYETSVEKLELEKEIMDMQPEEAVQMLHKEGMKFAGPNLW
jgi:hypothetical protein